MCLKEIGNAKDPLGTGWSPGQDTKSLWSHVVQKGAISEVLNPLERYLPESNFGTMLYLSF